MCVGSDLGHRNRQNHLNGHGAGGAGVWRGLGSVAVASRTVALCCVLWSLSERALTQTCPAGHPSSSW